MKHRVRCIVKDVLDFVIETAEQNESTVLFYI